VEIEPPAIIVIGEVVRMRQSLRWFDAPKYPGSNGTYSRLPLIGKRVLNTQPGAEDLQELLNQRLKEMGAEPVELPTFQILPPREFAPLDKALKCLGDSAGQHRPYDWLIFTSEPAVTFTLTRLLSLGFDVRALHGVKLGAVGKAANEKLCTFGLRADLILRNAGENGLPEELDELAGLRVLLSQSNLSNLGLAAALERHGVHVEPVVAYTVSPMISEGSRVARLLENCVDVVTFVNPLALHGLAGMLDGRGLPDLLASLTVACAGSATADAARAQGVRVDLESQEQSVGGLCEAMRVYFQNQAFGVRV